MRGLRDEAEAALAGAVAHLQTVLAYAEQVEDDAFARYPRELPSLDELVVALMGVTLKDEEEEASHEVG